MILFHDIKINYLSMLSDVIKLLCFTLHISISLFCDLVDILVYFNSISEVEVCKVADV